MGPSCGHPSVQKSRSLSRLGGIHFLAPLPDRSHPSFGPLYLQRRTPLLNEIPKLPITRPACVDDYRGKRLDSKRRRVIYLTYSITVDLIGRGRCLNILSVCAGRQVNVQDRPD